MSLNIKILLAALFISTATFAQQTGTKTDTDEAEQPLKTSGKKVGNISLGVYIPIAFGDNFVNNGLDLSPGARLSAKFNVFSDFYAGPYFSFFTASVENRKLLGNYNNANNIVLGGLLGYQKEINKFELSIGLGLGYSIYANRGLGDNFNDTATAVWLNPEISYRFATYWSVFLAPELRHDFMNIDVPKELEDTFKGVNYFNISFGIRVNLGSGYKYD